MPLLTIFMGWSEAYFSFNAKLYPWPLRRYTSVSQLAPWQWHDPCTVTMVAASWPLDRTGKAVNVGASLDAASDDFEQAASRSAASFNSGARSSCAAGKTVPNTPVIPTSKTKKKIIPYLFMGLIFMGLESLNRFHRIRGRYHTDARRNVVQADQGRSGMAEFQSPAATTHLAAPPPPQSL